MQGDGAEAFLLGHFGELDADDLAVVPAEAELYGERNADGFAHLAEDFADLGQVAQQARASVAADDALGWAAQVEVYGVEAGVFDDSCCIRERFGVGAEELGADGMFVVVEGQIALALGFSHAGEAVGGGELGHQQAAAGLLVGHFRLDARVFRGVSREKAGVADEAAEDRVGDADHGREHRGWSDLDPIRFRPDAQLSRHARFGGHGVGDRVVPVLLHGEAFTGHEILSGQLSVSEEQILHFVQDDNSLVNCANNEAPAAAEAFG